MNPSARFDIACLCAAWCRLCEGYGPVLDAAVAELQGAGVAVRSHWIDIEDEAALVGDLDVETFPTLVVMDAQGGVRFGGPVLPQPENIRRLLRSVLAADAPRGAAAGVAPEVLAFARRWREGPGQSHY